MNLRGWDYTGRNVGKELHTQFRKMVEALSSKTFVNHRIWGTNLQEDVAKAIGVSSSGAVRTIKTMCVMLGFINDKALSPREEVGTVPLLTKRGEALFATTNLEHQIDESENMDEDKKAAARKELMKLYEEVYCEAFMNFYYTYSDGSHLCPLRATLQALQKHKKLDKWEWYLLNTFVLHDDNSDEVAAFENALKDYREQKISLSMQNVVAKPKGHQYIPQYFEYAGLVHVVQRPEWSISVSSKHEDVKQKVLSENFLEELYRRKENE